MFKKTNAVILSYVPLTYPQMHPLRLAGNPVNITFRTTKVQKITATNITNITITNITKNNNYLHNKRNNY
ncbi:hypothetical protein LSH36_72g07001 [Paralvinella palmiformis]|uniref:Uncharacterized protein n=1 Tax=Paralvinella palmiformis TaxID=53620 RepID=A0AAD9ND72_9ANNE|nr:hypothetical protein LSH36_72g07001 [Paralvinella palmiformis]